VTYTSFNTNSFEKYGEAVMGSRGTMIIEEERDVFLYKEPEPGRAASGGRDTKVTVGTAGGGTPAMEASSTYGGTAGSAITRTAAGAPVWDSTVRGYRTEMEHFAYCVRRWQELKQPVSYEKKDGKLVHEEIVPRCHGEVAMADAIVALTANLAMDRKNPRRIDFDDAWFDPLSDKVPEITHQV
jgi:hypothetical protein